MALIAKMKSGELLVLPDGSAIKNRSQTTVTLVRLTKEETESELKSKVQKSTSIYGEKNEEKSNSTR